MTRDFLAVAAAVLLAGAPVLSQEFSDELVFDDDAFFEEAVSNTGSPGPDISVTLGFAASFLSGSGTETVNLRLRFSDRKDLGVFGFLEWSGYALLDDPFGAPTTSAGFDQLHLQNSAGNLSWKIGKFPISWGEVEGVPVLDVLNTGLSLATLGTASADLPGQWFASVDYFVGDMTFSGFVGLDPEVAHNAPVAAADNALEFGLRAALPINQGQLSLYAARLVPQSGVVELVSVTSSARPYTLVGISANRAYGAALLEFDLAAKSGLERASATDLSPQTRLDAALGIEYAASAKVQLTASAAVQHWLNQDDAYFDYGLNGPVAANQTTASYLLSATAGLNGSDLGLTLFLGGAFDGSVRFAALNAEFPVSDALRLSASVSQLWAEPGSLLAPVDGSRNISFAAEYFF